MVRILFVLALTGLTACSSPNVRPTPTATPVTDVPVVQEVTQPPPPTPTLYPWEDASGVMSGLCFASVYDAAGRTFVIRSADALQQFFDLADNSHLCKHPVQRGSFDFSNGRILAGLWSKAIGCTAQHQVINVRQDDVAHTYVIFLRLVVKSGCDYELVRPFWIGLSDLTDYDVRLLVQSAR